MVKNALTAGAPSRTPLTLGPSGRLRSPAPSWTKGEEMGWEEEGYEGKEEREWERRGGKEIGEGTGGEGKGKEKEGEEKGRRERVWPYLQLLDPPVLSLVVVICRQYSSCCCLAGCFYRSTFHQA